MKLTVSSMGSIICQSFSYLGSKKVDAEMGTNLSLKRFKVKQHSVIDTLSLHGPCN